MDNSKPTIRADDSSRFPSDSSVQALDAELVRSRANLKMVFDHSDQAIYSVDRNFRLVAHNSVLEEIMHRLWGIQLKEGMDLRKYLPPEEAGFWDVALTRAYCGEPFTVERTYETPDRRAIMDFS